VTVGVQKAWSLTASDNGSADDNINFAEQQTPASLNNSARALMASVKGWANQISAAKTTGGSSNAYTFTSDSVAAIATSYAAGMAFAFKANHTNTGAATLNVDGVGAKNIRKGVRGER
jgi:type IV secretory pathway VirB9-like protein